MERAEVPSSSQDLDDHSGQEQQLHTVGGAAHLPSTATHNKRPTKVPSELPELRLVGTDQGDCPVGGVDDVDGGLHHAHQQVRHRQRVRRCKARQGRRQREPTQSATPSKGNGTRGAAGGVGGENDGGKDGQVLPYARERAGERVAARMNEKDFRPRSS